MRRRSVLYTSVQVPQIAITPAISRPVIEVSGVRKTYGATVAVAEASFEVREGEISALSVQRRRQNHHHGVH